MGGLVQRYFALSEIETWLKLPRERQTEAFFTCWTRKEAYLKALGQGLLAPLNSFAVSMTPGEQPPLERAVLQQQKAEDWSFYHVESLKGYVGAVAIRGRGWRLALWRWCPSRG